MSQFIPFEGYITKQSSGWLRIKLSNNDEVSIPQYSKVKVIEPLNRDQFTVLEGQYKNKKASIKHKDVGGSYIKEGYHIDTGGGSTIRIKLKSDDEIVSVPRYVSVKPISSSESARDSFIILQGKYKNQFASIAKKESGETYIVKGKYLDTGNSSNIRIKLDNNQIVSVPLFINVRLDGSMCRDDFEILQGFYKGKTASVQSKTGGGSYITRTKPSFKRGASLIFNREKELLKVPGLGIFNAFSKYTPIALGTYDIEMPDAPHVSNSSYSNAKLYRVWFRLGHSGDRYLHCGLRTAGCITVLDIDKWDQICNHLLLCRKDDKNIGTITVVKKW